MDLPIVFLHYGRSKYLPFTLGRAKMLNVNSPVVLIGDAANKDYLPFVEHVDMNRYAAQAAEFQRAYKHLSPNGYSYEMFCFMRWFILRDFLRGHGLKEIIHLDSDVLINVNVQEERRNWLGYGLTILRKECAGNMFVNGLAALEALCDIIWDLYTGPASQGRLAELLQRRGHISDMAALELLCQANPAHVAEMDGIQPDGSFWDANINLSQGFETGRDGMKVMRWINGMPYGRHLASGRDILFKSLHYQGMSKDAIEPAFRQAYPLPRHSFSPMAAAAA